MAPTGTALWRSGPSEKPTLCNSCGTRWRLKGTLADYIPKHGLIHLETLSETIVKGLPLSIKVPRRKRSVLRHTHIKRLHQQLLEILHEQYGEKNGEDGNDLLIHNTSWMTSSNESTALGAMLLK